MPNALLTAISGGLGTLSDSALSSNIPRKNQENVFTSKTIFNDKVGVNADPVERLEVGGNIKATGSINGASFSIGENAVYAYSLATVSFIPYFDGSGLINSPMFYDGPGEALWTGTPNTVIGNGLYFGNTTTGASIIANDGLMTSSSSDGWSFLHQIYLNNYPLNLDNSSYLQANGSGYTTAYGTGWDFTQSVNMQSNTLNLDASGYASLYSDGAGNTTFWLNGSANAYIQGDTNGFTHAYGNAFYFNQPVYFDSIAIAGILSDASGNTTLWFNNGINGNYTSFSSDSWGNLYLSAIYLNFQGATLNLDNSGAYIYAGNGYTYAYGSGWTFNQNIDLAGNTLTLNSGAHLNSDGSGYVTLYGYYGFNGAPSGNYIIEAYGSIRASDMLVGANVRTGEITLGNITGVQSALSSNSYNSYTATLTGNVTLSIDDAIADVTQSLIIVVTQNAVGNYTITWGGSNIHFPSGTPPAPVLTALSKSLYEFKWAGGKWNLTNFIGGLA